MFWEEFFIFVMDKKNCEYIKDNKDKEDYGISKCEPMDLIHNKEYEYNHRGKIGFMIFPKKCRCKTEIYHPMDSNVDDDKVLSIRANMGGEVHHPR